MVVLILSGVTAWHAVEFDCPDEEDWDGLPATNHVSARAIQALAGWLLTGPLDGTAFAPQTIVQQEPGIGSVRP